MRDLSARVYFEVCRAAGRLLRATTYSHVRLVNRGGEVQVCKRRSSYAPLLVCVGASLSRLLDTGVRVLGQRHWEERERRMYRSLRDTSVRVERDGTLVLPRLSGHTLATLLDDPERPDQARRSAVALAVAALTGFHRLGFTHADAMAENVMVDLDAGRADWFDFETVHDERRAAVWQRADDVRALLVTCVIRTPPDKRGEMLRLVLDVYADDDVARQVATFFTSVWRRALAFRLAQACLSFQEFREIGQMLLSPRAM